MINKKELNVQVLKSVLIIVLIIHIYFANMQSQVHKTFVSCDVLMCIQKIFYTINVLQTLRKKQKNKIILELSKILKIF